MQRRKVFNVGAAYLVVSWLLLPELRLWVASQGVAIKMITNYRASLNAMLARGNAQPGTHADSARPAQ